MHFHPVTLTFQAFPSDWHCSEDELLLTHDFISTPDCSKVSGNDAISATMFISSACSLVPTIDKFLNHSIIGTSNFSQNWKLARVVSIPKKENNTNPANYKPLSI